MKIYLVTCEWCIGGDHSWDNYAFKNKEDAEKCIKKDRESAVKDIKNGDYGSIFDDVDFSNDYLIDNSYGDFISWSIEELNVQ